MEFCLSRARAVLGAAALLLVMASSRDAFAQAALADDDDDDEVAAPAAAVEEPAFGPRIGVGLRLRNVRLPKSLLELFVDHAPGGSSQIGFGAEVIRRKGAFEFSFGLEYEKISVKDGVWVERDKPPPANEVDFVEFEDFGWITADVTFLHHTQFGPYFALRYGGGAGIGFFLGDVVRTDYRCTSTDIENDCEGYSGSENDRTPYDLPPVFPVLTGLFGGQITPIPNLAINLEVGIRTLPFFGTTVAYYF
jgi:hypothetical protein